MVDSRCLHGCGLFPDTVLLYTEEEGSCPCIKEGLVQGIVQDDPVRIVEL